MAALTLTQVLKGGLALDIRHQDGSQVPQSMIRGTPQWMSSDENIARVQASANGYEANIFGVRSGIATISVSAQADLGDGPVTLTKEYEVEVAPRGTPVMNIFQSGSLSQQS